MNINSALADREAALIALKIPDTRDFMKKLLIADDFDTFLVSEASVTTFTTFRVDGTWHPDFFEEDAPPALTWKLVRPVLFGIIRGSRTPNHFRIVLKLADHNVQALLKQGGVPAAADQVDGLFLNLSYSSDTLTCTTGTSMKVFTLDRTLDRVWDDMVQRFFAAHRITYESI